jgi:hypothetical protein
MNMNSTSPSCDNPFSIPRLCGSKMRACRSGASAPNTTGPITKPAAISPTTDAWPK